MKKVIFAALLVSPFFVNAASFDCDKASTVIETTICSDSVLSQSDERLNEVYKLARTNDATVVSSQKEWIKIRNKAGSVEELDILHEDRIKELEIIAGINKIQPMQRKSVAVEEVQEVIPEPVLEHPFESETDVADSDSVNIDDIRMFINAVEQQKDGFADLDGDLVYVDGIDKAPSWMRVCMRKSVGLSMEELKMTANDHGELDSVIKNETQLTNLFINSSIQEMTRQISSGETSEEVAKFGCMMLGVK